jgi:serine/threonine-protein kinase HipA
MNPVSRADGLKLNITEADNALDLELAREVSEYFRINLKQADEIIADFRGIVSQWRTIAERLALPFREQAQMADAFRLADR